MGNNIEKSLEDFEGVKASISDYGDDEFNFEFIKVKGTPILYRIMLGFGKI